MLLGEEMPPLFMDTGYEPNSPSSLSAEESHSNTAGSEREGEGQQMEKRGTKRQEKNRDAARKSRKKQTERADELHEELQSLERSNSALHKEIASLKKELHLYMTALDRHKPLCRLQDSAPDSSSAICPSVSPSDKCQSSSSPPRVHTEAPRTTQPAAPCCMGLSAPTTTTSTSSNSSSSEHFAFSSPVTVPYSASFTTIPASHSLFSDDPPTLIASRPTNVTPVCTSFVSNPVPSSCLTTAGRSSQGANQERSSVSEKAFSTLQPGALDALIMKQASFQTASSNVVPPYSHSAAVTAGLVTHGCSMNVPQLHPGHIGENPIISSPLHSLSLSTLQDPALQSLSAFPQANPELCPASAFASKSSYSQHAAPSPASLLSLLTVPSPVNMSQTTSSSLDGPPSQPPPSLPPSGDPSGDLSLSELLAVNDWILQ